MFQKTPMQGILQQRYVQDKGEEQGKRNIKWGLSGRVISWVMCISISSQPTCLQSSSQSKHRHLFIQQTFSQRTSDAKYLWNAAFLNFQLLFQKPSFHSFFPPRASVPTNASVTGKLPEVFESFVVSFKFIIFSSACHVDLTL